MDNQDKISASNSWIGTPGDAQSVSGWMNITVLAKRRAFILYTAIRGGRKYVIKALRDEFAGDASYLNWLEKECRIGMEIDHPGVVRVEGMFTIPQISRQNVMVMEWIDGVNLGEFLASGPSSGERRRVAFELAETLEYIHSKGMCHRDLKPDNVMVTRRGGHARIIDFGLGDAESYIGMKNPRGTQRYGAPEQQTESPVDIDSTADVWSYGRLLEDLHCGHGFGRLAKRCMLKEPGKRPVMKDVVRRISRLQQGSSSLKLLVFLAVTCIMALAVGFFIGTKEVSTVNETPPVDSLSKTDSLKSDTVWIMPQQNIESQKSAEPETRIIELTENEAGVDALLERTFNEYLKLVEKYKGSHDKAFNEGDFEKLSEIMLAYNKEYNKIEEELSEKLRSMGLSERRVSEIRAGFSFRVLKNKSFD